MSVKVFRQDILLLSIALQACWTKLLQPNFASPAEYSLWHVNMTFWFKQSNSGLTKTLSDILKRVDVELLQRDRNLQLAYKRFPYLNIWIVSDLRQNVSFILSSTNNDYHTLTHSFAWLNKTFYTVQKRTCDLLYYNMSLTCWTKSL